jgi:protein-tyrosine phosphatase
MTQAPLRILFVCSGNICRSPLAEALFKHMADAAGLGSRFVVDSAGTHGYHEGDRADPRTRRVGQRHGVEVTSIAREVEDADFDRFDLIVAMDRGHKRELVARAGSAARAKKIRLMREFDPAADALDVPDPYYDGDGAFERVYAILDAACRGLFKTLRG